MDGWMDGWTDGRRNRIRKTKKIIEGAIWVIYQT